MARPRKKIDPLQVEQLAMIGCPNSEIAGILGCDEAILCRHFDRAIRKGQLRRNIDQKFGIVHVEEEEESG